MASGGSGILDVSSRLSRRSPKIAYSYNFAARKMRALWRVAGRHEFMIVNIEAAASFYLSGLGDLSGNNK